MNIKDLQYIIAIAKTKNFSKAAHLLFISQPALSQHIKRVENSFGTKFFIRTKNSVSLTPAGEEFVKQGEHILEKIDKLEFTIRHFEKKQKDTLSLGVSQFYGRHLLGDLINCFAMNLPKYKIKIIEGESKYLENLIVAKKLDFGVFPAPIYNKKINFVTLYKEKIMFSFNNKNTDAINLLNEAIENNKINLGFYKSFPFIFLKEGLKLRILSKRICKEFNFFPYAIFETENLDTVYSMILNNYGVGFLPSTMLPNIDVSKVTCLEIASRFVSRDLVLAYNEDCFACDFIQPLILAAQKEMGNKYNI